MAQSLMICFSPHYTLPKLTQTRQSYHLYFLLIPPKKWIIFTKLYKVAPGDTNLLFTPNYRGIRSNEWRCVKGAEIESPFGFEYVDDL